MTAKQLFGGFMASLGFILSPLSWWNDVIINIPLAYLIASGLNYFIPGYFSMLMIIAYWLTNVLGLVLMHQGGRLVVDNGEGTYTIRSVIHDLKVAFIYSLFIAALIITGVLKLPAEYF